MTLEDELTVLVPAHVELTFESIDPLLGCLQWGVGGAGSVIHKNWPVGRQGFLLQNPGAGVVGEILVEGVVGFATRRWDHADGLRVLCEFGVPLIGFSADEAVEVVEALMGGPMIVRAGVCGFCVRDEMPLADASGCVPIFAKHLRDEGCGLWDGAGIARKTVGPINDRTHTYGVIIATRHEGGARRRAKSCNSEARVAETVSGQTVEGRSRDETAKCSGLTITGVVEQDEQDVWRALRRSDGRGRDGDGGGYLGCDGALKWCEWDGKYGSVGCLRLCKRIEEKRNDDGAGGFAETGGT